MGESIYETNELEESIILSNVPVPFHRQKDSVVVEQILQLRWWEMLAHHSVVDKCTENLGVEYQAIQCYCSKANVEFE